MFVAKMNPFFRLPRILLGCVNVLITKLTVVILDMMTPSGPDLLQEVLLVVVKKKVEARPSRVLTSTQLTQSWLTMLDDFSIQSFSGYFSSVIEEPRSEHCLSLEKKIASKQGLNLIRVQIGLEKKIINVSLHDRAGLNIYLSNILHRIL